MVSPVIDQFETKDILALKCLCSFILIMRFTKFQTHADYSFHPEVALKTTPRSMPTTPKSRKRLGSNTDHASSGSGECAAIHSRERIVKSTSVAERETRYATAGSAM